MQEPELTDSSYKTALLSVDLGGKLNCVIENTGELSLLYRALDIPFLEEMQARLAFNQRRSFRVTIIATADQLRKLGFAEPSESASELMEA